MYTHDGLCLMQHALALPKLHYVLRSTPCFFSGLLETMDMAQHYTFWSLSVIISLDDDLWKQASLPIISGGLGIRSATSLALSTAACLCCSGWAPLLSSSLPQYILDTRLPVHEDAFLVGSGLSLTDPPSGSASLHKTEERGCPNH